EPDGHVARQREAQQLRIKQTRIELQLLPLEIDLAQKVHLHPQDSCTLIRQNRSQHSQQRQPHRLRHFDHQPQVYGYQRWRAPGDLRHWTKDEAPAGGRKHLAQIADNAIRIGHYIGRKQNAAERVVAQPGAQWVDVDSAIQSQQSADAVELEAQTQLNRRELGADDDQQ